MSKDRLFIAQIGKTVGLKGDLKLNLHTDFPQQFRKGLTISTDRGELKISDFNPKRALIRFEGYDTPESARKLTNAKVYSDIEKTKELCPLKDGEYYWFDIIGSKVIDDGETIGTVKEIQRLLDTDYLLIETDDYLVSKSLPSNFLLPYIPRYIIDVDTKEHKIYTKDAKDILEAS